MKKAITFGMICFLFMQVCAAAQKPTAKELLDKFAIQRENYKSFTAKTENKINMTIKSHSSQFQTEKTESFNNMDFRFDLNGRRSKNVTTWIGNINALARNVKRDNPMCTSWLHLINDNIYITYGRQNMTTDKGRVTLSKKPYPDANQTAIRHLARGYKGHEALGYFYGDDTSFDKVLRNASNIAVRQQMEKVGDSNCYVIDAVTDCGRYAVWIDPERGYNVAKAKIIRKEGDRLYNETTIRKGDSYYITLDNAKFQKFDGVWAPVDADIEYVMHLPKIFDYHETIHHKVIEYKFNSDHDALGSFDSDDIQDGAEVRMADENGKIELDKDQKPFIWRDGDVIDKDGKVVLNCKNKAAEPNNIN